MDRVIFATAVYKITLSPPDEKQSNLPRLTTLSNPNTYKNVIIMTNQLQAKLARTKREEFLHLFSSRR
ncbi:MAG: hypothetical protein ACK41O_15440 [Runella zeae]